VDWRTDQLVTKVMHQDGIDLGAVAAIYSRLEQEAVETLLRDGIEQSRMRLQREADVRYVGQSMEVRVPAPAGSIDAKFLSALIDAFHAAHKRTFGYNYAGQQKIELVNFCVSGFGLIERPEIPKLAAGGEAMPARKATRPVYFDGAFRDTPVYDRGALRPGIRIEGPTVIEEFGSTTVVFPGQFLEIDPHGILIIRRTQESRP
jgi:N-methylhydantoinase A